MNTLAKMMAIRNSIRHRHQRQPAGRRGTRLAVPAERPAEGKQREIRLGATAIGYPAAAFWQLRGYVAGTGFEPV
jgi:hypothetical protein